MNDILTLNDLPKHNLKIRLLIESIPVLPKSESELCREFNDDKWGGLLFTCLESDLSLEEIRNLEIPQDLNLAGLHRKSLSFISPRIARNEISSKFIEILSVCTFDELIEIGSGYGQFLFELENKLGLLKV